VAGDGTTLYWAWHDDAGRLMESHSVDDGATWSRAVELGRGGFVYTPALDGRADGTATVAWVQSEPYQAVAVRLDASRGDPVVASVVLEASTTAQSAEFSGLRHDGDGHALIVYAWDPGDDSCADLRHPANRACIHFVREL
jgi:mannose/cellobiose epimerase-like protein (N-acyl-D-glucosamine 2-epimerase family)